MTITEQFHPNFVREYAGRRPQQYEGSSMGIAIQLVREMDPADQYRFGQARVIALEFERMFPTGSATRKFWSEVRADITELQADHAAPEAEKTGYGIDEDGAVRRHAGDRVLFTHVDQGLVPVELVKNGYGRCFGIWETRVLSSLDGVALHTTFVQERDMIDPDKCPKSE